MYIHNFPCHQAKSGARAASERAFQRLESRGARARSSRTAGAAAGKYVFHFPIKTCARGRVYLLYNVCDGAHSLIADPLRYFSTPMCTQPKRPLAHALRLHMYMMLQPNETTAEKYI